MKRLSVKNSKLQTNASNALIFIYNLSLFLYASLLRLISPFHGKARLWTEGRKDWRAQLSQQQFGQGNAPVAWFHAASLGEFEQARPLIEAFRAQRPDWKIALTFFSPSGYEIRKNYAQADWVGYLPLDTAKNATDFIALLKPQVAFFVKYEFWHHYTKALQQEQIPCYLFSGIFRPSQTFFKPYGAFFRSILHKYTYLFLQDQASGDLLKSIGVNNFLVCGDTRYDRVLEIAGQAKEISIVSKFKQHYPCLVVGSSWDADIDVLLPLINEFPYPLKFIIAPHEISKAHLEYIEQRCKKKCIRYSNADNIDASEATVLLIDNIGMLSSLYRYGDFAYIGGAFGKGLHNILEAAVYGVPVFFGPHHEKFREAIEMQQIGAAFAVNSAEALKEKFTTLYENVPLQNRLAVIAADFVKQRAGATSVILQHIKQQSV